MVGRRGPGDRLVQRVPRSADPKVGDPVISLEQVFRGDHALIRAGLIGPDGVPKPQPVLRKTWNDKQARNVILTLAPVEVSTDNYDIPPIAGVILTGPVTGILTWGIEGGDAKEIEFDWGSATYSLGVPDGRGSGLQMTFPASYVQLDARNWMGSTPPFGGFPDASPVFVFPVDAILRAHFTVGAASQRLTPITRTLYDQDPGAGKTVLVVAMAKRVQVLRYPVLGTTMDLKVFDAPAGPAIDQVLLPAGVRCPILDLTPDAVAVEYALTGPVERVRIVYELAI